MMSRIGTVLLAVALVSALLAVPLGVSAVATAQTEPNESDQVAPGERMAGVVGIQEASVSEDLSERRYETRLERADTDDERADIVAERRDEIERRLGDHRSELAELRTEREAGNITEGTYRARVATLAAEKGSTERAAARTSETASQLPADVLEERGVSVDELQALRANASELGGAETADIAREIGGPNGSTPAAGDRAGGPASTHTSNTTVEEATEDRRTAESDERTGGDSQSTGSGGADGDGTSTTDDSPTQQDDSDDRDQRNTDSQDRTVEADR